MHRSDPSFSVTCGIKGCQDKFETSGFSSHVYRHHRKEISSTEEEDINSDNNDGVNSPVRPPHSITGVPAETADYPYAEEGTNLSEVVYRPNTPLQDTADESAAKFLLHLREGRAFHRSLFQMSLQGAEPCACSHWRSLSIQCKRTLSKLVLVVKRWMVLVIL